MYKVNSVTPYTSKVNFKSDNQRKAYSQYVIEPQYDVVQTQKPKKHYSAAQIIGVASSGVVLAFFGWLLGRELHTSYLKTKVKKLMKNCKNEEIKRALEEEFDKGAMSMSNKKINALVKLSQVKDDAAKPIDIEQAKAILDKSVIGMEGVKKQVIKFLEYRNKCIEKGIKPDRPLVLALNGPAGTAKTTLAAAIAKATGLPYKELKMGGATGKSKIIGNESVYQGASWGDIADAQIEHGTKSIVYTFDELEKIGESRYNGSPDDALLSFFDDRHKIKDDFLGVELDLSDSIAIITTNEFERLSEPLKDRISYKFNIDPYKFEDKAKVAKLKFNLSMKHHEIDDKVEVDDKVFDIIANSVTDEGGREATIIAENFAHDIFTMPVGPEGKIKVTTEMIEDWLKQSKNAS